MKVGIILRGITTGTAFNGPRNWTLTKDNIKENLIDSFRKNHNVYVYITTYADSPVDDVVNFYQPSRLNLIPLRDSNQRMTMRASCLDIEGEDVDFVIITRFDIEFLQPFGDLNFDYTKFNFLYKEIEPNWTRDKFVSDIIFGFPKKYLIDFVKCIEMEEAMPSRNYNDLHNAYNRMCELIGRDNIHFICDEPHPKVEGQNHYVKIIRV